MTSDDMNEDMMGKYMEMGVIEMVGMDPNGELILAITDKAKILAPELWEAHQEHVDQTLVQLYKMGLIKVEYNENLEAIISMSPEGQHLAREFGIIPMDKYFGPND